MFKINEKRLEIAFICCLQLENHGRNAFDAF